MDMPHLLDRLYDFFLLRDPGRHESKQFSASPDYQGLLKAPAFVGVGGSDRAGMVAELVNLKARVDERLAKARNKEGVR